MRSIHSTDGNGGELNTGIPRKDSSELTTLFKAPNWLLQAKMDFGFDGMALSPNLEEITRRKTNHLDMHLAEVVYEIDNTVEMIEKVAEVTEKISSEIAELLPDGGGMKQVALKVEHASEEVLKDAQTIDNFFHKVEEQVEGKDVDSSRKQGTL
ncbi:uncharacterized protein A4U43_C03F18690 [Asparagus officinalis]|uniref:Uncharacterized protein n=1 Tax=Asparagus officinalis TaxID=4686 RepID=A0A5P1FFH4_ASPOF|nr:uncharacterized protein A4U43_C03F18690 [Asparagus officinalis]